jgi:hypothetical protein
VTVWLIIGLFGLATFVVLAGGPVAYLSRLGETGSRASGLIYVIWLALALKYSGLTVLGHYWASGKGRRRNVVLLVVGVTLLLSMFGQRAFIGLMFVQVAMLYTLIRRPIPVRIAAPVALAVVAAITFGIGTVKRYDSYRSQPSVEKLSFIDYVRERAPKEVVRAYVGNYADGVRLIALARTVVPHRANYEKGRGFVRLAFQPIPSFVRPKVRVAEPLRPLLEVNDGYSYALPIPLVSYVEFSFIGVLLGGGVLAFALIAVDRQLAKDRRDLSSLLVLVAIAVQIPFCLRTGMPRGVSFAALDVIGMWIVAHTCLRAPRQHTNTRQDAPARD